MKDLLYISHPYIDEIRAKVKKKKYYNNYTKLTLDRSIFMPQNSYLLDEKAKISSFKLLDYKTIENEVVYIVDGKVESKEVDLKIDRKNRIKNLYYNTAFYIFKAIFYQFYNIKDLRLSIGEKKSTIKIENFYEDFDLLAFKELFDKIVRLGLDINIIDNEFSIDGFERFTQQGVFLKNTKSLEGLYIFSVEKIDDKLLIDFIVGDDYLHFIDKSMDLINHIKKIAIGDLNSSEKIRKIISAIQNQTF